MTLFILIFFVMVIAVGTAAVAGFSFFLKRRTVKRLTETNQNQFDEPPKYRSLFEPSAEEIESFQKEENEKLQAGKRAIFRQNLTERANDDDFTVLTETKSADDSTLYFELLNLLTKHAEFDSEKLVRLADFVSENDLPANEALARDVLKVWQNDSSAIPTAKVLHVSALSNSAENYLKTIEEIAASRKDKSLKITDEELFTLFETHYWLLSNKTRTSGAGFLLKEKLTELRGELSKR